MAAWCLGNMTAAKAVAVTPLLGGDVTNVFFLIHHRRVTAHRAAREMTAACGVYTGAKHIISNPA